MKKNGAEIACAVCGTIRYIKGSMIRRINFCSKACQHSGAKRLGVFKDRRGTLEQRFWSKVKKTDRCWLWIGSVSKNGYGTFWDGSKVETASRLAYKLQYSVALSHDDLVCHTCDNPICVRKSHLFIGTNADNRQDCVNKGRAKGATGEANCKAKLTEKDVEEIRASSLNGPTLGAIFGVHRNTIYSIQQRQTWR